jgi:uncharacterized YigZ family protein
MNVYNTIEKASEAEFKDRGSKFLAFARPIAAVDDFKKILKSLKEDHPKAAHFCFAYRLGTEGNIFRSSDDGEPAGSAGKPILGQIDSKNLTNIAVVVVRYFGGTLLGVPGLINAYKMVTSLALQITPITQRPVLAVYDLQFDYTLQNDIMMVIKRFECVVLKTESQLFCFMQIGVPKSVETACVAKLAEMHSVSLRKLLQ